MAFGLLLHNIQSLPTINLAPRFTLLFLIHIHSFFFHSLFYGLLLFPIHISSTQSLINSLSISHCSPQFLALTSTILTHSIPFTTLDTFNCNNNNRQWFTIPHSVNQNKKTSLINLRPFNETYISRYQYTLRESGNLAITAVIILSLQSIVRL